MNLKNYTSSVPIDQSILYIERLLSQAGATHIGKEYDPASPGEVVGMTFQLVVDGVPLLFQLPSEVRPIEEYMLAQLRNPKAAAEKRVQEQAGRTAWKMLHEWVHIQISNIEVKRMKPLQVFLPFLYDPKKGKTYFEILEQNRFKALPTASNAERSEPE